jgi:hypothetical protein
MDSARYARTTDEHERLKRLYAAAVSRLFAIGYQVTDSEFQKLKALTGDLRIDLEIARREVERESAKKLIGRSA